MSLYIRANYFFVFCKTADNLDMLTEILNNNAYKTTAVSLF